MPSSSYYYVIIIIIIATYEATLKAKHDDDDRSSEPYDECIKIVYPYFFHFCQMAKDVVLTEGNGFFVYYRFRSIFPMPYFNSVNFSEL